MISCSQNSSVFRIFKMLTFSEASRFVGLKEKLLLFIVYLNMQGRALLLASRYAEQNTNRLRLTERLFKEDKVLAPNFFAFENYRTTKICS